ncbi:MAG: cytochrome c3 family protein [Planctomycetota bacterium]|nr:cytochrome c3 family protein [Planctomycetota bacterium]
MIPTKPHRALWRLATALLAAMPAAGAWSAAQAEEVSQAQIANKRCLECHGQPKMADYPPGERRTMLAPSTQPAAPNAPAKRPGLYVLPSFAAGAHAKLACTDCHKMALAPGETQIRLPHAAPMPPATCSGGACHDKPGSDYLQGAHAQAVAKGTPNAPTCSYCHGGHDVLPKSDRRSRTHPLNVISLCGDCHSRHTGKTPAGHVDKEYVESYRQSVHGKAILGGLAAVATCADCHGSHMVLPAQDPRSSVSRYKIPGTCSGGDRCHSGALQDAFAASIHGQRLAQEKDHGGLASIEKDAFKAPTCTDCHSSHAITRKDNPSFMLDVATECGQCHDKPLPGSTRKTSLYETYRRSYHGQVNRLGSSRGARCSDCHGAHDIRKLDDPAGRLFGDNRLGVCRKCHVDAGPKFALFDAHADHTDAKRYPLLYGVWWYFIIMMSAAFGFFGLHCLLWFLRTVIDRIKHGPGPRHVADTHAIQRFNRVDRINHAFVILSFFGLTLTGLPLLYAEQDWARKLIGMLGGVRGAGLLHRFFALMLIGNFAVHFVGIYHRFRRYGIKKMLFGPATMLPKWKDVKDALGMFRWFFVGGKKPAFERWTYWEKFDYMAEVGGSFIIGVTGLLLWFPAMFSNVLPGWMFNVATVIHGYEALLAIGFIFTIHFFNAHLRMEKFPVDDVIFTGRLAEEEFKHERGAEYDRLAASGELEQLRVSPPKRGYRLLAILVGILAMGIGLTLVALIILAGLKLL